MMASENIIDPFGSKLPETAQLLKGLAHPLRLKLVKLLEGGEMSVGGLIDQLELPQAVISVQLAVLRRAGLVTVRDHGPSRLYRLSDARILTLIGLAEQITTP